MTTTTFDTRTLRNASRSWVPAGNGRRDAAVGDGQRLLAVFAVATAVTIALILVLGLLAAPGGDPASASGSVPASNAVDAALAYVARPGDSLWSIAVDHHGSAALDRYVDALIRLNGGTAIQVGQTVRLP